MVTLKIEAKTDSFEDAEILIKEALRSIKSGSQAGIIGGGIGECVFDVDLSAAQQPFVPEASPVERLRGEVWETDEELPTGV